MAATHGAKRAAETGALDDALLGIQSPSGRARMQSAKLLAELAASEPEAVYQRFDAVAALLGGENQIVQWNAMRALGSLAQVDAEGRIERILPLLLKPIGGRALISAANAIAAAAAIAETKPHLADRIAAHILKVEAASFPTPECFHVARGHAVRALDRIYPHCKRKKPVLDFVRRQIENPRASTRKAATAFLARRAPE
jgi:hypothetical protein